MKGEHGLELAHASDRANDHAIRHAVDHAIHATLQVIASPAVPSGMEERLLAAMRQRQAIASPPGRLLSAWTLRTFAIAGFAVVAMATATLLRQPHVGRRWAATASVQPQRSPATAAHEASARIARAIPPPLPSATRAAAHPAGEAMLAKPLSGASVFGPLQTAADAQNEPPPPLPLTEEERLLLRLANRGEPLQMAALDDAQTRGIDFAAQKTQFDDFFYLHTREQIDEDK